MLIAFITSIHNLTEDISAEKTNTPVVGEINCPVSLSRRIDLGSFCGSGHFQECIQIKINRLARLMGQQRALPKMKSCDAYVR